MPALRLQTSQAGLFGTGRTSSRLGRVATRDFPPISTVVYLSEQFMPEQIKMTHDQLADLIVKDVRRHAHCNGFKSISLHKLADGEIPGTNWSPASANYGDAGTLVCDEALREIIPRM